MAILQRTLNARMQPAPGLSIGPMLRYSQIVGPDESDISSGRISISSPLARALIGKTVGDSAEVSTPGGTRSYEIVKVAFV